MFCYALIKTIYKSKCTCIKIATFLLGCRLFCFIVVFYLDIKLLKLSLIKVILLQYISHRSTEFLNQGFFLFCAFLLYIATQAAQTSGARPVWCCTQNLDECADRKWRISSLILWFIFSKKSPDETHKSLINSSFWLKKQSIRHITTQTAILL